MSTPIVPYYNVSVLHHPFMSILKRLVFHILKLQWLAFRTNCDYLIANCKPPIPCHKPPALRIEIFRKLAEKKHLLRAIEIAILCSYFLGAGGKMLKCRGR